MASEFGKKCSDSIIQVIHEGYVYRYEPSTKTIFVGTLKEVESRHFINGMAVRIWLSI